jgi:FkbM family methyltransferase
LPHYCADLPHKVIDEADDVLKAFELWSDAQSRREYLAQLRWRLLFEFDEPSVPDVNAIYFPADLFKLHDSELFVDCGAFDGDTLQDFVNKSNGSFEQIVAFEPDPINFSRLVDRVHQLPDPLRERIEVHRAALARMPGTTRFAALGSPASHLGEGEIEVELINLDQCLSGRRATYVKMDIEGTESEALAGASEHIRNHAPILAISAYHWQHDLWAIPLLIHSLNSSYSFFLRPHDLEGWDLVCYAIPNSRLQDRPALERQ